MGVPPCRGYSPGGCAWRRVRRGCFERVNSNWVCAGCLVRAEYLLVRGCLQQSIAS
jgi:hypothetical protein